MQKPNWYNKISKTFMSRGYLEPSQTIEEKIEDMSNYAEHVLGKKGFAERLKEHITKGNYIIPTPCWTNFNFKSKSSSISCFGMYIDDSVPSILDGVGEMGMQSKIGGGTSGYFNLRGRGSEISGGGISNGAVSFMEMFQTTARIISQASRRGHFAATLDIHHDDIDEFLKIRSDGHPIQDLSFSVSVDDKFMESLLNEDKRAMELWSRIIESRFATGFPYVFFKDNVNDNRPEVYKDKDKTVNHSNMCQPEEATVLIKTENGARIGQMGELKIGDLIWSGKQWTKVVDKWSNGIKEVFKYSTTTGYFLGTDNHRIFSNGNKIEVGKSQTIDWSIGDSTELTGDLDLQSVMDGLVLGDGSVHKASNNLVHLLIGSKDHDYFDSEIKGLIKKHRPGLGNTAYEIETTVTYNEIPKTYERVVPDRFYYGNEKIKRSFLRGLFSANGSVVGDRVVLTQSSYKLISQVQEMVSSMGIASYITVTKGRPTKFSNGTYLTKDGYSLNITAGRDLFSKHIGFIQKYKNEKIKPSGRSRYLTSDIKTIESLGQKEVFEITVEAEEHSYWTGGVLASNCHEIALPNDSEESFVCCLLGMNLELYDEWKDTDAVEVGIYFMDAMLTDFIKKNKDTPYMQRAVRFAERHRAIGLGSSGYHSYLQSKMIPFESLQAIMVNKIIFKNIKEQAVKASEKMANEYGKPEMLSEDNYKRRHTTLMAIAPNTSSSFVMGQQSQSIEPYVSNYYVKDVAKTRVEVKNPYLKKLLKDKGIDNEDTWKSILFNNGSVQSLGALSEDEKLVFKTYSEINQYDIVNQASDRQKYIDQSQSLNLMIPVGTDPDDVSAVMIHAWEKGIKTLYYQLNVNVAQNFTNDIFNQECTACQG